MDKNYREHMKSILFDIFKAHQRHEMSYKNYEYRKTLVECFVEQSGGDEIKGYTLYLMGSDNMFNDIQEMAPHFGVGYRFATRNGEIVKDIPPAPGPQWTWDSDNEMWVEPKPNIKSEKIKEMSWPLI